MSESEKEMFSKILVAIDGSEESLDAAQYALYIANRYSVTDLIALYVLPQEIRYDCAVDRINPDIPSSPVKGIIELANLQAEEWFNKIKYGAQESKKFMLHRRVLVATKSIAAEIVDYAESNRIDLIVIGTRGRSGLKRLLLGSVASSVVTYAHCPVMVVK